MLICVNFLCNEMSHFSVQPGVGSVPSATTTITSTPMHMCQPLLDAVATNMKSPMFNHALQQTFGPAMTALFGAPIRYNTIFRSDRQPFDLSHFIFRRAEEFYFSLFFHYVILRFLFLWKLHSPLSLHSDCYDFEILQCSTSRGHSKVKNVTRPSCIVCISSK